MYCPPPLTGKAGLTRSDGGLPAGCLYSRPTTCHHLERGGAGIGEHPPWLRNMIMSPPSSAEAKN
jgi:hypothetical protein